METPAAAKVPVLPGLAVTPAPALALAAASGRTGTGTGGGSPPLPAAPIAQSAGARAQRLDELYRSCITRVLRTCSYDAFAACFPTPAHQRPSALRSVWSQVVSKIEAKADSEFAAILREADVLPRLNALDRLLGEAGSRRAQAGPDAPVPTAPHTLPPADLVQAHLSPTLVSMSAELEQTLSTTQTENERLAQDILDQRRELDQLISTLETAARDLELANRTLESTVEKNGVRQEVRDISAELTSPV